VLAVCPEAATLVWPDEEEAWIESVRTTARESDIDVVAAYVIQTSATPFAFRNEYRLVLRDSTVEPANAKHPPMPGEPCIAGVGPAPIVKREWGWLSGAICYDYDFPAMGRSDADIVAVPASDWRGIDPVHAQMAPLCARLSSDTRCCARRDGAYHSQSIPMDAHERRTAPSSVGRGLCSPSCRAPAFARFTQSGVMLRCWWRPDCSRA
jgi:hypothetical protein